MFSAVKLNFLERGEHSLMVKNNKIYVHSSDIICGTR